MKLLKLFLNPETFKIELKKQKWLNWWNNQVMVEKDSVNLISFCAIVGDFVVLRVWDGTNGFSCQEI